MKTHPADRHCDRCFNAVTVDYGYSNYTVEGTTVYCLPDKNPDLPADRWYGQDKVLEFAILCPEWVEGGPFFEADVDNGFRYASEEEKGVLMKAGIINDEEAEAVVTWEKFF